MLPYLGVISRENMQIEGFWYYLFLGVLRRQPSTTRWRKYSTRCCSGTAGVATPAGRRWCWIFCPISSRRSRARKNWASSATSAQRPAPQRRCVNGSCRTHHAISVKGTGGLKAKSEPSRSRFILFAAAYSADLLLFPFSLSCSDPILCQRRICNCADQKSLKYCAAITGKCYRISFGAFWRQGASTLNREY